jgi:hypothetical protein
VKTPSEFQIDRLLAHAYDPVKAHDYYEKHKKLKGREPSAQIALVPRSKPTTKVASTWGTGGKKGPLAGKTKSEIHSQSRARQRKELAAAIQGLEQRLNKLQALIVKRLHEEASENRKGKAKKERATKEANKPATAAEKAKQARENKKYQDKHQQKLKTKSKSSGGSSSSSSKTDTTSSGSKQSSAELQSLATKVKGQIAVAKRKLAAL